jgi:hypothetical protein
MILTGLDACRPPRWARGGHAQTLMGHFLTSPIPANEADLHQVVLPDGDCLAVLHYKAPQKSADVVYLFHGLGGSTDSDYMRRGVCLFRDQGYHVYAVNHRGCGAGQGLARYPYHSGRGEDLSAVIDFGRRRHPQSRHLAVGFSLSGNALLLLLTGRRGDIKPDAAIAVNAPIDLKATALDMRRGLNRIYDVRFVRRLLRDLRLRYRGGLLARPVSLPTLASLYDFDEVYTAPAGGFADRFDYYRTCSTVDRLTEIQTPTMLLTARDDPMVDFTHYRRAKRSSSVCLHAEDHGGHMGYLARGRGLLGFRRWLDDALLHYATVLLPPIARDPT